MTQLEIALKLREQIKEQWPFVSTILALYANNTNGQFTERIQDMVDRLLPKEVYFVVLNTFLINNFPVLVGTKNKDGIFLLEECGINNIESLPINQVLFASEDNPLEILK